MISTYLRVAVRRPSGTRWLDAYPGESTNESPTPDRIDAAVVRTSSVTRLSWLRFEFRNMEIDGPGVPPFPPTAGVLGNRGRRGPSMRADDAMARFGDLPADNMVVLIRGRRGGAPRLLSFWTNDIEAITVYELLTASGAVRRAFEISTPAQLHRDNIQRQATPGSNYTQEQLVFGFVPGDFRSITDFDEMRLGKRPGQPPEESL